MQEFTFRQEIGQLEKRKGGYFYIKVDSNIVDQFKLKKRTRLICTIDDMLVFPCGLNHLGDGNYYIIVSTKNLQKLKRQIGDLVNINLKPDPNPLGVGVPDVLIAYLEQVPSAKELYEKLTDGKKRSFIFSFNKIKNLDLQIAKIEAYFEKLAEK